MLFHKETRTEDQRVQRTSWSLLTIAFKAAGKSRAGTRLRWIHKKVPRMQFSASGGLWFSSKESIAVNRIHYR